jgi:aspartate carbamoyltransferase catalytic subunit
MLFSLRKYVLLLLTLSCCKQLTAQQTKEFTHIDTALFQDNAHHWYDIVEKTAVIHPSFNQPKYQSTQLQEIANNVLLYQKENGVYLRITIYYHINSTTKRYIATKQAVCLYNF